MESTILDFITQKEISDVLDIGSKRIKQKEQNHYNLISHVKNVPYKVNSGPKIVSSHLNLPITNVTPKEYMKTLEGESRPINVKENNFVNIKKRLNSILNEAVDNKGDILMSESNEVSTNQIVTNNKNLIEINEHFKELDDNRQLVQNVKVEAEMAENAAKETDENLNKLGIEQTEIEKKLEDAKIRKEEIKKKVIEALNNQSDILKKAKQNYEDVIISANQRKEENQNKIVEFQTKLDESKKKLTMEEAEIAEQQALLDALNNSENPIMFSNPEVNKEEYKKIV